MCLLKFKAVLIYMSKINKYIKYTFYGRHSNVGARVVFNTTWAAALIARDPMQARLQGATSEKNKNKMMTGNGVINVAASRTSVHSNSHPRDNRTAIHMCTQEASPV